MTASHAVRRLSLAGSQSSGNSVGRNKRTLPWLEVAMPAASRPEHAGVPGVGEGLGGAVLPRLEPLLLKPGQCPPAVRVEVAFLLGERLIEGLIDERGAPRVRSSACRMRRAPLAYRVKTAMPGPMAAWARSTGAM